MKKEVIKGCEGRGDADSPYLTRYTLLEFKNWQLCLHIFHRSDSPELHDHPWNFYTLPLLHGYREMVRYSETDMRLEEVKPWRLRFRPAEYAHRVILHSRFRVDDNYQLHVTKKKAVTLVLMTKRRREWGFFTKVGWTKWRQYFADNGC